MHLPRPVWPARVKRSLGPARRLQASRELLRPHVVTIRSWQRPLAPLRFGLWCGSDGSLFACEWDCGAVLGRERGKGRGRTLMQGRQRQGDAPSDRVLGCDAVWCGSRLSLSRRVASLAYGISFRFEL